MTPEKLKGQIRAVAKKKGLSSQEVLQMALFERVLERLSKSRYSDNFILKGGFLIASMIGVNERTTMDMDTTVVGIPMKKNEIEEIVKEILATEIDDGICFEYGRISNIVEDAEYNNYRVYFNAKYGKINNPMKMDITTGDVITPAAIEYQYESILDGKTINIKSYNLETVLAEKYETIIRRNIGNTRARDYYDIHALLRVYENTINYDMLKRAIEKTASSRGSSPILTEWEEIVNEIEHEESIKMLWKNYQAEYSYAKEISFDEIISSLRRLVEKVN